MSALRRIGHYLARPWLAPLLNEAALCRGCVLFVLIVGGGHLLGYSLWPCLFAQLTGLPCPGCGMTRAVAALLRLEWWQGVHYHPFAPIFMGFGLLITVCAVAPKGLRERISRLVYRVESVTRFASVFLFAALIYGLLRMGGLCSNHAPVERRIVPTWMQLRQERA